MFYFRVSLCLVLGDKIQMGLTFEKTYLCIGKILYVTFKKIFWLNWDSFFSGGSEARLSASSINIESTDRIFSSFWMYEKKIHSSKRKSSSFPLEFLNSGSEYIIFAERRTTRRLLFSPCFKIVNTFDWCWQICPIFGSSTAIVLFIVEELLLKKLRGRLTNWYRRCLFLSLWCINTTLHA